MGWLRTLSLSLSLSLSLADRGEYSAVE